MVPDLSQPALEPELYVRNYVVCVLDLLGQKDKLKEWDELPLAPPLPPAFINGMKSTIGPVSVFKKSFLEFFKAQQSSTVFTDAALALMTDEEQAQYHRQRDIQLGVEQFSDTFVFYAPIANTAGELQVLPVYAILGACCMAMLMSLAIKVPFRGGVHIATGIKDPELSFYGPALAVAHQLESEIAQYPRVVVSPAVVAWVRQELPNNYCPRLDSWARGMLDISRNFLYVDRYDNNATVDWLGRGFRQLVGAAAYPITLGTLRKAHDFVGQTAQSFEQRAATDKNPRDVKLAKRYHLLYHYMLNRLPEWGIQFTDGDAGMEGVGDGE